MVCTVPTWRIKCDMANHLPQPTAAIFRPFLNRRQPPLTFAQGAKKRKFSVKNKVSLVFVAMLCDPLATFIHTFMWTMVCFYANICSTCRHFSLGCAKKTFFPLLPLSSCVVHIRHKTFKQKRHNYRKKVETRIKSQSGKIFRAFRH